MTKSGTTLEEPGEGLVGRRHPVPAQVDPKQLARALKALKIDVPYYSVRMLSGGGMEIVTRDGRRVWKPRARRKRKGVVR